MKAAIFKSTGAIITYIIVAILLALVGYNWWGWFGGKKADEGYPNFKNMTKPQLIEWLVKNAGLDQAQLEGKTQQELAGIANSAYGNVEYGNPNGSTGVAGGRYSDDTYNPEQEDNSSERTIGTIPVVPQQWSYEYVKGSSSLLNWALVGYANNPIGKSLKVGDTIQTNPKSGIYRIDSVNYGNPRDSISISPAVKGNTLAPPPQGNIIRITTPVSPPTPNIWYFDTVIDNGSVLALKAPYKGIMSALPSGKAVTYVDKANGINFQSKFIQSYQQGNEYIFEIQNTFGKIPTSSKGYISF